MGNHRHSYNRQPSDKFPWGWFIFFLLCLPLGGPGIVLFIGVLLFVKFFTKLVRS
jgi:hypothetical protein